MGRGLSYLQRSIIKSAMMHRTQEAEQKFSEIDVSFPVLLIELFDWPGDVDRLMKSPTGQKFTRQDVGEQKYNSNTASLSRAITRLEQRGLVKVWVGATYKWTGIWLTASGVTEALKD